MTAYTSNMSTAPAARRLSPAAATLSTHLASSAVVSTLPPDPLGKPGAPYLEPTVCVGWTCPSGPLTPGIVADPIYVCPIPVAEDVAGAGEYVVSYRQTAVVSVLLDLPATVEGLMAMVREGRYRPAPPRPAPPRLTRRSAALPDCDPRHHPPPRSGLHPYVCRHTLEP